MTNVFTNYFHIFVTNQPQFQMKKIVFIFLFVCLSISAQKIDLSYYLPQDVTYNKNIPTPKSVISFPAFESEIFSA